MPGVVRFEPCCKVRGVANIEVGVRGSVPQDVDIMEVRCWHGGSIVDVEGECKLEVHEVRMKTVCGMQRSGFVSHYRSLSGGFVR